MLPYDCWHPWPGEVGQGGQKVLRLLRHSQKTCAPNQKDFFTSATTRLAASFDTSTRSVTRTGARYIRAKPRAIQLFCFFCEPLESTHTSKC